MKIAWKGPPGSPSKARSASNDSFCRPNAFRSTVIPMRPRGWIRSSSTHVATSTMPAHVAKIPPEKVRIGSKRPFLPINREIVVDSPPGIARASHPARSAARRTVTTAELVPNPRCSSARQNATICSLTFPWSARTPILASTVLQHLIFPEGMDVKSWHCVAEAGADPCNYLRVIEIVDRFYDRFCHSFGTRRLEDP